MPDLVLFLDIDQEKTSQRLGFGDEVMERTDFQQLVYANMNKLFDPRYWRVCIFLTAYIKILFQRIDAAGEKTKVNSQIIEEVGKVLAKLTNSLPAKFALHDWKLTT
jgi:thymidylate kinase